MQYQVLKEIMTLDSNVHDIINRDLLPDNVKLALEFLHQCFAVPGGVLRSDLICDGDTPKFLKNHNKASTHYNKDLVDQWLSYDPVFIGKFFDDFDGMIPKNVNLLFFFTFCAFTDVGVHKKQGGNKLKRDKFSVRELEFVAYLVMIEG